MVADTLHTIIRISEKLLEATVAALRTHDKDHGSKFVRCFAELFEKLSRVPHPYTKNEGRQLEFRSFTGDESMDIFQQLSIKELNPENKLIHEID